MGLYVSRFRRTTQYKVFYPTKGKGKGQGSDCVGVSARHTSGGVTVLKRRVGDTRTVSLLTVFDQFFTSGVWGICPNGNPVLTRYVEVFQ